MAGAPVLELEAAAQALARGAVLAYPAEGVWGLGCLPGDAAAVARLLAAKRRAPDKGLILIADRAAAFAPYLAPLDEAAWRALEAGAGTTWLAPANPDAPPELRGRHPTQAVRVTRHPVCMALCREAGALVSTSANVEGAAPARSLAEARAVFGDAIDGLAAGELGGAAGPSEIRDLASGRVLRPAAA